MDLDEIKKVIKAWAYDQPLIKRAFIFGSRVRGDAQPDSDLDVAVELYLGADDNNILSTWMFEGDEMKDSLQGLIPFKLHLELLDGQKTLPILNGVQESGMMVYEDSND